MWAARPGNDSSPRRSRETRQGLSADVLTRAATLRTIYYMMACWHGRGPTGRGRHLLWATLPPLPRRALPAGPRLSLESCTYVEERKCKCGRVVSASRGWPGVFGFKKWKRGGREPLHIVINNPNSLACVLCFCTMYVSVSYYLWMIPYALKLWLKCQRWTPSKSVGPSIPAFLHSLLGKWQTISHFVALCEWDLVLEWDH